jgi:hypothetical protein
LAPDPPSDPPPGSRSRTDRSESRAERADRNFAEILQGFRVAVTGVQVLFAFLLTVPFSEGFAKLTDPGRTLYIVALAAAALASICYIAPTAQHRILFRQGLKELLVNRSNRYGLSGGVALVISMTAAASMVADYLYGGLLPVLLGGAVALLSGWSWFLQPVLTRMKARRDE